MPLLPVAVDPITKLRIDGIQAHPLELISGADPVAFPPPDGTLCPIGVVDDNYFLLVYWDDEDKHHWEAVVRVEAM